MSAAPPDDAIVAVTLEIRRTAAVVTKVGDTVSPFLDTRPAWVVTARHWKGPNTAWMYTPDEYGDHADMAAKAHARMLIEEMEA